MARVFITGSSEGLGFMAGRLLAEEGYSVILHARNAPRAEATRRRVPDAEAVLVANVSTIDAMRDLAEQANARGRCDAVIHNVGVGYREPRRVETADGLSQLWAVNVLAPYVLTALMLRPDRLIYLTSGMHTIGDPTLDDIQWAHRRWSGSQAYADTKLHDMLLTMAVARRWPAVRSNAVTPGWVPTRMGGPGAPDDLDQAYLTQVWLAVSEDADAQVSGGHFYHQRPERVHPAARQVSLQDRLLDYCQDVSGIALPPA
jgi:NAD(P)-dependent dehydrogenase (short-subunit alcohol dehydrogenase family)